MSDIDKYPLFEYNGRSIIKLSIFKQVFNYHYHHFVPKRLLKKYPDLIKYQKMILLPCDMHFELHYGGNDKKFFNRYKVERWDLIFNIKKYRQGYYKNEA